MEEGGDLLRVKMERLEWDRQTCLPGQHRGALAWRVEGKLLVG